MTKLRAQIEGCEVTVAIDDEANLSPQLREALADLADALHAEQAASAEVAGFGLNLGGLGLSGAPGPVGTNIWSCWGYDDTGGKSCTWFSQSGDPGDPSPMTCKLYST